MNPNLEKLKSLLQVANDGLNKSEFIASFQAVMKHLLQLEKNLVLKNDKSLLEMIKQCDEMCKKMEIGNMKDFSMLKKDVMSVMNRLLKDQENGMNFLRDKVMTLKDGKDGERGPKGDEGPKGEKGDEGPEGPKGKDGKDGKNGSGGSGGSRGIQLYVDGVKKGQQSTVNLIPGAGITLSYSQAYGRNDITITATGSASLTPIAITGTIDDSNTSFTAASTPNIVIINGASYRDGHGVTISGTTITLSNPVGVGGDLYGL